MTQRVTHLGNQVWFQKNSDGYRPRKALLFSISKVHLETRKMVLRGLHIFAKFSGTQRHPLGESLRHPLEEPTISLLHSSTWKSKRALDLINLGPPKIDANIFVFVNSVNTSNFHSCSQCSQDGMTRDTNQCTNRVWLDFAAPDFEKRHPPYSH